MQRTRGLLYLPIEVKVREWEAKLLLAYYAILAGYEVIIGEHAMVELASANCGKGIFFFERLSPRIQKKSITKCEKQWS
ncbi:hypothetical protein GCM10010978_19350 [Compostibacillus humi]|uniref:Uncharacterized protein n=1 Tax=Compostibacillus humi TaxID=1245525 RepID=A0A8J2TKG9_9BACI|nr:hypothetical protein [Compostibacillus humi]GFZ77884.1 hypothetical protein GCM10010978_19350 [Compostibacillus humi]